METAGVAPIRAQYLTTKEKFHAYLDQEGEPKNSQEDGKEAEKKICRDLSEPPAKLQKTEEVGNSSSKIEEGNKAEDESKKENGSEVAEGNKAEDESKKENSSEVAEGDKAEDDNKKENGSEVAVGDKAEDESKKENSGEVAEGNKAKEGRTTEDGSNKAEEDGSERKDGDKAEDGRTTEAGNQAEEVSGNAKQRQGRKRARGQNKIRPCLKPAEYEKHRLCPSIVQDRGGKCLFGSQCSYIHDIKEYVALKPPDLGDTCVLFRTFGKCAYGVTCRFASAHLGKDSENLADEDLVKQWEGKTLVKNSIGKELQHQLRKKKFPFEKASAYLSHLAEAAEAKEAERQAPWSHAGDPEFANFPPPSRGFPPSAPFWGMPPAPYAFQREEPSPMYWEGPCPRPPPLIPHLKRAGTVTDEDRIKLRPAEKRKLDLSGKLYLAPLTTCGNLPFRRVCKRFGADVTCGEMAVCTNLLQGQTSEWALLKRHHTEDIFGVQLEGSFPDTMTKCAELLNKTVEVDFVDINAGCPIDLVYNKGGGAALMSRMTKFEQIVKGMNYVLDVPLTVKIRTGVQEKTNLAHKLIPNLREWGVSLVTLHGRSREQRYTKAANWSYIAECAKLAHPMPLFGNGDILSFEDAHQAMQTGVSGIMIARGALIKPWIFTEIKEQRHWDISSSERLDILKDFTNYGLEQWGSDTQGVEKTRRFLLEWLSFLCRYIPVGLLERFPQRINERPPYYMGRDYLETLMASQNAGDWIKISEILLGPVLPNFTFLPKHKANSYK